LPDVTAMMLELLAKALEASSDIGAHGSARKLG
jgi:hypothetical protein